MADLLYDEQCEIFNKLKNFESNVKKTPKARITSGYIEARIDLLQSYFNTYVANDKELRALKKDHKYFTDNEYGTCEELFLDVKGRLKDMTSTLYTSIGKHQTNIEASTAIVSDFKMPCIELPKFSGDYLKWTCFRDLFKSIIHENKNNSEVQKLHFLKANISGEAEQLLSNLSVTAVNYETAWNILTERYENKRIIIKSYMDLLIKQSNIQTESSAAIKKLLDTTSEALGALKNLGLPIDHWDAWIVYITVQRLDCESHRQWERSSIKSDLSSWDDLRVFLNERFRVLESTSIQPKGKSTFNTKPSSFNIKNLHASSNSACLCCEKLHFLYQCSLFRKQTVDSRRIFAKNNQLCFNCLKSGHLSSDCPNPTLCKKCKQRHHTILHKDNYHATKNNTEQKVVQKSISSQETVSSNQQEAARQTISSSPHNVSSNETCLAAHTNQEILLATALVFVQSSTGTLIKLRALLDQGAQTSFISSKAAYKLGLELKPSNVSVTGIGSSSAGRIQSQVKIVVQSCYASNFKFTTNALVLKKITGMLPSKCVSSANWLHIRQLQLADPNYNQPGEIDLLLGANVYGHVLTDGLMQIDGAPIAQNTHFGWILSGRTQIENDEPNNVINLHTCIDVKEMLQRFWEIEDVQSTRTLTHEEILCEQFYETTYRQNEEGNFIVQLPFKKDIDSRTFGDTRNMAVASLLSLERRFLKNKQLQLEYCTFMDDYLSQGHMELAPQNNEESATYYIPHHAVFKLSSTTTKLRVVFDASRPSSNGVSLNERLVVGPPLQSDMFAIIMRWRKHMIAFMADIKQMYRQIYISKQNQPLQKIVWRRNANDSILNYHLKTVTYGTSCAPYLAIKTLRQLAINQQHKYPAAANIVLNEFYVDDLMSGSDDVESALKLQSDLIKLLQSGGFQLRKWSANHDALIETVPENHRETTTLLNIDIDESVKALGIYWNPTRDEFGFKVDMKPASTATKRSILSDVARLFDPLGWLSPSIIKAKIFLQQLWLLGVSWDDNIPTELLSMWLQYRQELQELAKIKISRWLGNTKSQQYCELHGFCDASNMAYAAVIYNRVVLADGTVVVKLIASKTKVAPIKQLSIPRLELCGAVLLAKLFKKVTESMNYTNISTHAFTDSTIVLCWIKHHPSRWKTFIANRVSEIQRSNITQWHHISSQENPADVASRGISPLLLQSHPLWWSGPLWLHNHYSEWPITIPKMNPPDDLEERNLVAAHTSQLIQWDLVDKYSSLTTLLRVTAVIMRFTKNTRTKSDEREIGFLKALEINNARLYWIKYCQHNAFTEDIACLKNDATLPKKSRLTSLNPFLDAHGLLRISGRAKNSNLPYNQNHSMILPKHNTFTNLIVHHAHHATLHGGTEQMLAYIRQQFCILDCKNVIRHFIHKCISCFKQRAKTRNQLMGSLPQSRVVPGRPFQRTGVDYAGPIDVRATRLRGTVTYKSYIAVFVCFTTKAIHIELVSDLTTTSFVAAFKRFCSRRGHVSHMYSDNATTFVGATAELNKTHRIAINQLNSSMAKILATDGTQWHFIPPASPHFGGLWEAGVKSIKRHLKRVIGDKMLSFEELQTVLIQIEGALNSRPLCPMSNDADDLAVLTPGHFLIGEAVNAVPESDLSNQPENRLTRWQLTQKLFQNFWHRWSSEYLSRLQQRPKWTIKQAELQIGDLVLVKDDRLPPSKWSLARILEKHPGRDGLTRVYTVKCKDSTLKRSIVKLCPLPTNESYDQNPINSSLYQ